MLGNRYKLTLQGKFMQNIQANTPQQAVLQEKVLSAFEQSLTEEQHFLQDIMTGKIKLIPHEEVMAKLEYVLKNGLQRK